MAATVRRGPTLTRRIPKQWSRPRSAKSSRPCVSDGSRLAGSRIQWRCTLICSVHNLLTLALPPAFADHLFPVEASPGPGPHAKPLALCPSGLLDAGSLACR